jgi:hypothetical protein
MERIQIRITKTPPSSFKCAMVGCSDFGVHRITERADGEWSRAHQDFCDVHFAEFMNNGLLDAVPDV